MRIELYIEQLLYRHQCVIIPGFGAFLTELVPARLEESTHTFFAPQKAVSFNPLLKNNDGLLAHHVSQMEKMDYDQAVDAICKQVTAWKAVLRESRSLTMAGIGVVSLNYDDRLVFESSENANYFTGAFGLGLFVSPAIKREVWAFATQTAEVAEETPALFIAEKSNSRQWLKYAAIFTIGLGTSGFFGNRYYQDRIARETRIVQGEVQKEVGQKIQEATFFIENPLPNVTLPVKELHTPYHIVYGAFRKESNADKVVSQLTTEGFRARKLPLNRFGLFPVVYGSYATYGEAHTTLSEIRKTANSEAWLLVTK